MNTDPTIKELVGYRARTLEHYQIALDAVAAASQLARKACLADHTLGYAPSPAVVFGGDRYGGKNVDAFRKELDRYIWRAVLNNLGLAAMFDAQARKEFEATLEKDPPEATEDNISATAFRLAGQADVIFARGMVNVFRDLSHDFKSHDAFKLGQRLVLDRAFSVSKYSRPDGTMGDWANWNHWGNPSDKLYDLERVIYRLDGKDQPGREGGILNLIRGMKETAATADDEYFTVKRYKNGNLHIWLKRDDLTEKANRLIAKHAGAVLGDAS